MGRQSLGLGNRVSEEPIMSDRDPRRQPAKDDELAVTIDSGHTLRLRVAGAGPTYVYFHAGDSKYVSDLTHRGWRSLTRNARVVTVAEESNP